jgi:diadenosine tetraphosphate (Ap4A) HIT family hydrolase
MTLQLDPASVIHAGPTWTAAVNRNQHLLGKSMLVLNRPCEAVVDLTPEEWAELHVEVKRLVAALDTCFAPDQVNLSFLMNVDAQVHLHVIPRYAAPREWQGQTFTDEAWGAPAGTEPRPLAPAQLASLADELRAALRAQPR